MSGRRGLGKTTGLERKRERMHHPRTGRERIVFGLFGFAPGRGSRLFAGYRCWLPGARLKRGYIEGRRRIPSLPIPSIPTPARLTGHAFCPSQPGHSQNGRTTAGLRQQRSPLATQQVCSLIWAPLSPWRVVDFSYLRTPSSIPSIDVTWERSGQLARSLTLSIMYILDTM